VRPLLSSQNGRILLFPEAKREKPKLLKTRVGYPGDDKINRIIISG
jgi:hypothetical protein